MATFDMSQVVVAVKRISGDRGPVELGTKGVVVDEQGGFIFSLSYRVKFETGNEAWCDPNALSALRR